ncbi:hypothetical protein J6590_060857 [Homalodisca vitripennis]|nr:hypothetical protein J6590_060857 [Homalodisca vitripennis]
MTDSPVLHYKFAGKTRMGVVPVDISLSLESECTRNTSMDAFLADESIGVGQNCLLTQSIPGIRPPSFPPFNKMDVSVNSTDMITQQRAMPQTNSGGFDNAQPIGQMSPLHTPHTIRCSSSYSDCSSPLMEPSLLQNWTSRSISPSDSDVSNVSSADLSDIMNSLNLFQSGGICSPPTEQELANLRALHTLTSSPVLCTMRGSPSVPPSHWSLQLDRQLVFNENTDLLEKVARFHRNRADWVERAGRGVEGEGTQPNTLPLLWHWIGSTSLVILKIRTPKSFPEACNNESGYKTQLPDEAHRPNHHFTICPVMKLVVLIVNKYVSRPVFTEHSVIEKPRIQSVISSKNVEHLQPPPPTLNPD